MWTPDQKFQLLDTLEKIAQALSRIVEIEEGRQKREMDRLRAAAMGIGPEGF